MVTSKYKVVACGFSFVVISILAGLSMGYCEAGWTSKDKKCYRAFPASSTPGYGNPTKGEDYCREQGGHLMNPYNVELNIVAEKLIEETNAFRAFIGLNDRAEESVFVWGDGSPLNWSHWGDGEPTNSGRVLNEDCVEMFDYGPWNDIDCDKTTDDDYAILCEKEESADHIVLRVTHGEDCGKK